MPQRVVAGVDYAGETVAAALQTHQCRQVSGVIPQARARDAAAPDRRGRADKVDYPHITYQPPGSIGHRHRGRVASAAARRRAACLPISARTVHDVARRGQRTAAAACGRRPRFHAPGLAGHGAECPPRVLRKELCRNSRWASTRRTGSCDVRITRASRRPSSHNSPASGKNRRTNARKQPAAAAEQAVRRLQVKVFWQQLAIDQHERRQNDRSDDLGRLRGMNDRVVDDDHRGQGDHVVRQAIAHQGRSHEQRRDGS